MNAYVCSSDEIIEGTTFLNNFLDNEISNLYDLIIYETIAERDVFFSEFDHQTAEYFEKLNKKLFNKHIKLYFIFSAVEQEYYDLYNQSNIEIIYAPFYFINYLINENCTIDTWDTFNLDYKKNYLENNFDSLVLSLNNRPHYHRCLMMDEVHKTGLINYTAYTWQENKSKYDYYQFRWWNPVINSINMDNDSFNCFDVLYKNPAFHLITESEIIHISFSEKVFKSILSGVPFLVFSGVGFHKKLKEYGFELYDEIFDYSFDNIKSESTRASLICKNFLNYTNSDYKEVVSKIYHKIEKNRELALDILYQKKFIPIKLYDVFEKYIIDNKDHANQAYSRLNKYLF